MRIYTRKGDDGRTSLFGGRQVSKDDPRLDAYGTVDELNSALGLAAAAIHDPTIRERLDRIQADLFVLGGDLAAPERPSEGTQSQSVLQDYDVTSIEGWIDEAEALLPPIRNFILPGGTEPAARLHVARGVCRRAERLIVALAGRESVNPVNLRYINRLGDLLFVWARLANHQAGVADVIWQPRQPA